MTNNLQIFNSEEFGQIRTVDIKGKIFFVAKDVATALGYKDTINAIKRHCKWVSKHNLPHPQSKTKTIEVNIIPEGDIYRLIASSELPSAEQFESWIFDEVLPTIRKTGGYIADPETIVNTYFDTLDDNVKGIMLGLLQNAEIKQKIITEQKQEIDYKSEVISGLVDDISLADKRQILNRVVMKCSNFNDRWSELYKNFELKYHLDLNSRLNSYNKTHSPQMRNKLDYVEEIMGKMTELYDIACKLYESEVDILVQEMYKLHEVV